jgi:hypothetical protein
VSSFDSDQRNIAIATKLGGLFKLLDLSPYNQEGVYHQSRCKQAKKEIEPAHVICSISMKY